MSEHFINLFQGWIITISSKDLYDFFNLGILSPRFIFFNDKGSI